MKGILLALTGGLVSLGLHMQQPPPAAMPTQAPAALPARASFHIYLLMGQSNMVGRDVRNLSSQVDDPRIASLNAENRWVVAREPITSDSRIPVGQGPGIPFAQEMLKADSRITIGLVPCAVGGTPLRRWVKGADLYEQCLVRAHVAAKAGAIEGVLWHQGEADTGSEADAITYESRLTQMFKDLRSDLGLPGVPIVTGQLGPFLDPAKYPYLDQIRAAIRHLPADLPHVGYADSADLEDKGDKLHFSADSQKLFGIRYAKAMQRASVAQ